MNSKRTLLVLLLMFATFTFACGEEPNDKNNNNNNNNENINPDVDPDKDKDPPSTQFKLSVNPTAITENGRTSTWVGSTLYTAKDSGCAFKCVEGWSVSAGKGTSIDSIKLDYGDEKAITLHALDSKTLLLGTNYSVHHIDISTAVKRGKQLTSDGEFQNFVNLPDGRVAAARTNFGVSVMNADLSNERKLSLDKRIDSITSIKGGLLAAGFDSNKIYEVTILDDQLIPNDSWSVEGDYLWKIDRLKDGTILVAAGDKGLAIFDPSMKNLNYLLDPDLEKTNIADIAVIDDNHVLLADAEFGIKLVSLADRNKPVITHRLAVDDGFWRLSANKEGDFAAVSNGKSSDVYIGRYR